MNITRILISFLLIPFLTNSQNKIVFKITELPNENAVQHIFASGSFNNWNPADTNFLFKKNNGIWELTTSIGKGSYEYKITKGSWATVECDEKGNDIENRNLIVNGNQEYSIKIAGWQDQYSIARKQTASKQVIVLDTAFYIPQLNRYRRVWVYLPKNYRQASCKKYPVLYMHDGQNVFDEATSYSGEWGVDEFLDSVNSKLIVVAIDHGNNKRLNEYNPYDSKRFGAGEGKQYATFIVETLKPFIDKKYNTKRERKFTYTAGSSMGGLISTYLLAKYSHVFGGAGIFSPAYWVAGDSIYTSLQPLQKSKIYFYAGYEESDEMVPDMLKAFKILETQNNQIRVSIKSNATHSEVAWRKEFSGFYYWLMGVKN